VPPADDVTALTALALGYAAAVDTLDGPTFADLFTEDGELWVPDPRTGFAPTVVRSGRTRLERIPSGLAAYHRTHHAVWSATYGIDGDRATGEVAGVAHHLAPDEEEGATGGTDTVWYLRYADDCVRSGGRWLLARRTLHLTSIEERRIDPVGPGRR
jgi:SnoaL-like domain